MTFKHLCLTHPPTTPRLIDTVFVADVHLSQDTPQLTDAFIALLGQLSRLPKLRSLYILGDWLDAWIGDDDYLSLCPQQRANHWLCPVLLALQALRQRTQIFVMRGNRDFMLRQGLCDVFGGTLIDEPYFICTHKQTYRLEHGDKLCTDDKQYQRYRRIVRHPVVSWLLLKQPLHKRQQLAQKIKNKSAQNKTQKTPQIMDTNPASVNQALSTCDVLIHGHTHRPCTHISDNKSRLVLGDWRHQQHQVSAVIGVLSHGDVGLYEFLWVDEPKS